MPLWRGALSGRIAVELRDHAPFTMLGTLSGVGLLVAIVVLDVPRNVSTGLFWGLHPSHVFFSAVVTTALYTRYKPRRGWATVIIGYVGSVGIGTASDCLVPYIGEWLLGLPERHLHLGFIEKWWLVNPLAAAGVAIGALWPHTKVPHAGHVLLSTWASLFHMVMALGSSVGIGTYAVVPIFLFLAVWLPCCTSDIVFPLLFSGPTPPHAHCRN